MFITYHQTNLPKMIFYVGSSCHPFNTTTYHYTVHSPNTGYTFITHHQTNLPKPILKLLNINHTTLSALDTSNFTYHTTTLPILDTQYSILDTQYWILATLRTIIPPSCEVNASISVVIHGGIMSPWNRIAGWHLSRSLGVEEQN